MIEFIVKMIVYDETLILDVVLARNRNGRDIKTVESPNPDLKIGFMVKMRSFMMKLSFI